MKAGRARRPRSATVLFLTVAVLVLFGFVMMASVSGPYAVQKKGDVYHYAVRQGVWLVLGLGAAWASRRIDYHFWTRTEVVLPALGAITVALALCYVRPIGVRLNHSWRWIQIPGVEFARVQPSEFAKFMMIAFLAWWHTRVHPKWPGFWKGLAAPMGVLLVVLGLIACEKDLGTTALLLATAITVLYAAGARVGWMVALALLGVGLLAVAVRLDAERFGRVVAFLDPFEHQQDNGFQLLNALYGFVAGGARGLGLGQGIQKQWGYLPEAHTDFIFASIGEELGVVASLSVLALFVTLMICAYRIAARASDRCGQLLATGIATLVSVQAIVNIAVVTGSAPTKGLALPFISYGGSALLALLFMVGVLLNIAHLSEAANADARPD
ncbi:MAG: cell division protein FtsW [Kiritimatiellae bacterium]|nr:cell division protein FtsW [Kiritimatiellia bacterium]